MAHPSFVMQSDINYLLNIRHVLQIIINHCFLASGFKITEYQDELLRI